jgi:hypothetical protein
MQISRVRYRERQPLSATDLADEQSYRMAMRRRHQIAEHGWGIVIGLALVEEVDGILVQPGLAVDGYGRELLVPAPISLPAAAWGPLESKAVHVWLLYDRLPETPPQRGRWECGPDQHSRWREEARLRFTPASVIDPGQPVEVPDLEIGPQDLPADDPAREWPVYLGHVQHSGTAYEVNLANRPYVTLVGGVISAPSGRARMLIGSEMPGDRRRFAVSLPDASGSFTDRFSIDRDGNTLIHGDTTTADGDLAVAEAGARAAWSIELRPLSAPANVAMPWEMYHTVVTQNNTPIHQLRVEIGHPGDQGDPSRHQLVIGGWLDNPPGFDACLRVTADCTVEILGDLHVTGQILEGPVQADPDDPRFGAALLERWLRALTTAGTQTDAFYNALEVSLDTPYEISPGETLSYSVTVRNTSASEVTNIQLYETLSVRGRIERQGRMGSNELTLGPNQAVEISTAGIGMDYEVQGDEAGDIIVAVMALGVGAAANVVQASDRQTVPIVPPQTGPG